ncbi:chromatin-remodeling complex subunit ies6, partial [Bonamia ostreae]
KMAKTKIDHKNSKIKNHFYNGKLAVLKNDKFKKIVFPDLNLTLSAPKDLFVNKEKGEKSKQNECVEDFSKIIRKAIKKYKLSNKKGCGDGLYRRYKKNRSNKEQPKKFNLEKFRKTFDESNDYFSENGIKSAKPIYPNKKYCDITGLPVNIFILSQNILIRALV